MARLQERWSERAFPVILLFDGTLAERTVFSLEVIQISGLLMTFCGWICSKIDSSNLCLFVQSDYQPMMGLRNVSAYNWEKQHFYSYKDDCFTIVRLNDRFMIMGMNAFLLWITVLLLWK
jgi:hypothetical protein